jgi:alcohol dehydrogenase class IV
MFGYYMPTQLYHGARTLERTGFHARRLGLGHVLVVTDTVIADKPFFVTAMDALEGAGLRVTLFDRCLVDARLTHVDGCVDLVKRQGIDGVLGIGGGSVMCTAKAVAMTVPNAASFRGCAGPEKCRHKALPMIMIPTTAGSGAEVSQFTLVKDDATNAKLVGGGWFSFPDVALLDPVVLETIPRELASIATVDALSHAVEALFTDLATPLTDALALSAFIELVRCLRDKDDSEDRRTRNLLASSMANMACGNARLGLAHAASLPLEAHFNLVHGIGVGVLLPRVLRFNALVAPHKARQLANAIGVETTTEGAGDAMFDALIHLFEQIGFPTRFDDDAPFRESLPAMAEAALPGLYGASGSQNARRSTEVQSPNIRRATARDVLELDQACWR